MKKFFLIFFIVPISCLNISIHEERGLSDDQVKLKGLIDRYSVEYNNLPNQM
jgi:hypothetical protein